MKLGTRSKFLQCEMLECKNLVFFPSILKHYLKPLLTSFIEARMYVVYFIYKLSFDTFCVCVWSHWEKIDSLPVKLILADCFFLFIVVTTLNVCLFFSSFWSGFFFLSVFGFSSFSFCFFSLARLFLTTYFSVLCRSKVWYKQLRKNHPVC